MKMKWMISFCALTACNPTTQNQTPDLKPPVAEEKFFDVELPAPNGKTATLESCG